MKYTHLWLIVASLVILPVYGRSTIKSLTPKTAHFNDTQGDSTLAVRKMSAIDSKRAFNGINLISKNVQPLQVSVKNDTNRPMSIAHADIGLELIKPEEYQQLFVENNGLSTGAIVGLAIISTVIGGGIFAVSFYTFFVACYVGSASVMLVGVASMGIGASLPILVPTIAVLANRPSESFNEQGLEQSRNNGFMDQIVIEPHTTKDFLLLVKKEAYRDQFTIRVDSHTFQVNLPERVSRKTRLA